MSSGNKVGGSSPHLILSAGHLQQVVDEILSVGEFCFDVETRGVVDRHPDVLALIEDEWKDKQQTLKTSNEDVLARSKAAIIKRWTSDLGLDPLRNEVIWMGLAAGCKSWAIPLGHPNGEMLTPAVVGDGSTVPPPGHRKILKGGKESLAKGKFFIPATFSPAPEQMDKTTAFEIMRPLFMSDLVKVGHNVKFDARSIRKYLGGELPPGPFVDTMVLQHVLNENLTSYGLSFLIEQNFDSHKAYRVDGKLGAIISDTPFSAAARYVHLDVRWTWLLYKTLYRKLSQDSSLLNCFRQDMEVLRVLMDMEDNGIPVDHRAMKRLGKFLDQRLQELVREMYQYAPPGFNPASTNDKKNLIYGGKREGGLGIKVTRRTPSGEPSVDEEVLRKLENKHPIIPMLLEYNETKKLVSTYVEGLLPQLNKGRLHPSFHLHRTATGRLASSQPNLQNIPRESNVRSLFVAPTGYDLLVADYDQIELRVMCMFSHDKKMSEFFLNDIDIHTGAASLIFGKELDEVTSEDRQMGKMVNFLTAFGGQAFNLSEKAGVTLEEAEEFINSYYRRFSGLSAWKRQVLIDGRNKGYVSTISGRRRRLKDLSSTDQAARRRAERQAVNAVVQGSAADLCKRAMIDCHAALEGTGAQMLVQVHDELVVAVPSEMVEELQPIFVKAMGDGKVYDGIPLRVSCHSARSWAEAKGK